jgi:hypothetical protein
MTDLDLVPRYVAPPEEVLFSSEKAEIKIHEHTAIKVITHVLSPMASEEQRRWEEQEKRRKLKEGALAITDR